MPVFVGLKPVLTGRPGCRPSDVSVWTEPCSRSCRLRYVSAALGPWEPVGGAAVWIANPAGGYPGYDGAEMNGRVPGRKPDLR
jgi:hypothetical protein